MVFALLCNCENKGTIDPISKHGELLANMGRNISFVLKSDDREEIYFQTCETRACTKRIYSIDFKSKELSFLAGPLEFSSVGLVQNQEIIDRLLFFTTEIHVDSSTSSLREIILESGEIKELFKFPKNNLDIYNQLVANRKYIFFNDWNSSPDSLFIIKRDYNGSSELLSIRGIPVYSIPGSDQIIVKNQGILFLYDYVLKKILFQRSGIELEGKYGLDKTFYGYGYEIYFLEFSETYQRLLDITKNEIVYQSSDQIFLDISPKSSRFIYWIHGSSEFFNPQLFIGDLEGNRYDTNINLARQGFDIGVLFNDSRTIVYYSDGIFYKANGE